MKSNIFSFRVALTTVLCTGLLVAMNQPVAARIVKPVTGYSTKPSEDEPAKKAAAKKLQTVSRNNPAVKIYPDIIKRDMHVIAKGNEGKQIDFFVFDLEGTLVQNYKMKANDHYRIAGLARGTYVYRVFAGDEETASGRFDIR
jgi:hypothetical protein